MRKRRRVRRVAKWMGLTLSITFTVAVVASGYWGWGWWDGDDTLLAAIYPAYRARPAAAIKSPLRACRRRQTEVLPSVRHLAKIQEEIEV